MKKTLTKYYNGDLLIIIRETIKECKRHNMTTFHIYEKLLQYIGQSVYMNQREIYEFIKIYDAFVKNHHVYVNFINTIKCEYNKKKSIVKLYVSDQTFIIDKYGNILNNSIDTFYNYFGTIHNGIVKLLFIMVLNQIDEDTISVKDNLNLALVS